MSGMFSTDEIPAVGSVVWLTTKDGIAELSDRPVVIERRCNGNFWEFRELSKDRKRINKTRQYAVVKHLAGWFYADIYSKRWHDESA